MQSVDTGSAVARGSVAAAASKKPGAHLLALRVVGVCAALSLPRIPRPSFLCIHKCCNFNEVRIFFVFGGINAADHSMQAAGSTRQITAQSTGLCASLLAINMAIQHGHIENSENGKLMSFDDDWSVHRDNADLHTATRIQSPETFQPLQLRHHS